MALPLPFLRRPPLVGMVHLAALPGAPGFGGDLEAVERQAAEEAATIAAAGFDAVMVENFGDVPFYKDRLPAVTVAALTRCALAVRRAAPGLPLGINALRNDGLAALGIAVAVGAAFIRVNVLSGAMVTDQGIIEGCAAELLRARAALGARVAILADVAVKHAAPLHTLDLEASARDLVHRGGADALVVSGSGTGAPTDPGRVARVRAAVPGTPIFIGSGATAETLATLAADGYIVGTALKRAGRVDAAACGKLRAAADVLTA
ncbi:MAG: BtpA/SgcQ family protein [Myxococcales bacterium]|nr:BtpA/SgcQ family protein [Myxococcales bacterium]